MLERKISKLLRQRIVDLLNQEYNLGETFFDEIQGLYESVSDPKDKENFFSALLYIISHLEFSEDLAKEHWSKIIQRHKELSAKLGRNISVRTSVIDYFTYNNDVLKNPVVIEIFLYDSSEMKVYVDEMTGVYNYRYFKEALWSETRRSERYNLVFSLALIDIDDLKSINAKYGDDKGNLVIKTVAKVIDLNKRAEDTICRYGGDEFIILLPETSKAGAIAFISRIKRKLEEALNEKGLSATVSIGISEFPTDSRDPAHLVELADKALYTAKLRGKNRTVAWNKDL
ncbi:MAG: GGDEF domain-containing protein [Spirochaetia bacterium]|nr:GGDEF domain-containing protein [Spirochaetota bacterium]MDW8111720.1 GGDEF domain-containing protein [Spirochaetia bacterium]